MTNQDNTATFDATALKLLHMLQDPDMLDVVDAQAGTTWAPEIKVLCKQIYDLL